MKKIILLIITIIIIGGVIYAWQISKFNSNTPTTELDIKSETNNWNTYRNEKIGFEIKYPTDWTTVVDNTNPWLIIGFREVNLETGDPSFSRIYIQLQDNPNNYSLEEYYKNFSDTAEMYIPNYFEIGTVQNIIIDNREATRFSIIPGVVPNTMISVPLDHAILEIVKHNDYEPADQIYDLMIQSLKFNEQKILLN